jgi:hypothetical protein
MIGKGEEDYLAEGCCLAGGPVVRMTTHGGDACGCWSCRRCWSWSYCRCFV